MIFQDPFDSLNPKMTVFNIVSEPIIGHNALKDYSEMEAMVNEALAKSDLYPPEAYLDRYPYELSGGERQRVGIARGKNWCQYCSLMNLSEYCLQNGNNCNVRRKHMLFPALSFCIYPGPYNSDLQIYNR